jgi:hypothetical protein
MNRIPARTLGYSAGLLLLTTLGWILTGHAAKPLKPHIPLPTDWSHNHVIFTQPATEEQARIIGQDPRYWQEVYRQGQSKVLNPEVSSLIPESSAPRPDWSQTLGGTAAPGRGNYPAKFSFSSATANCGSATTPDYVVYTTGATGSATRATVVAFDNLYSGCGGTVPSVYWAYRTGVGLILTSPVISLDGTQVAFVQTSGSPAGQAGLVVLKWKASTTQTVGAPGAPNVVPNNSYRTCPTLPCMTQVFLHDGNGVAVDDRTSSSYYDYKNDIAWVGDATGWLHKVTGVFLGNPQEVATGGFPVHVNNGNPLSNPVFDRVSQNVFVGDAGGVLHRVSAANGATINSGQLDFGAGLVESPVLDVVNSAIYVFASSDGTTTASCANVACAAVYKFPTTFSAGSTGSKVQVGTSVAAGNTPNPMFLGGFDRNYYNSVGGTGNLYVCGATGANPTLYRIPITAGTLGTPLAIGTLTIGGAVPACSPVTDFLNPFAAGGAAEHLYFSAQNRSQPTTCSFGGCAMNFLDTPWQASAQFNVGQQILVVQGTTALIETAVVAGKTGASSPVWPTNPAIKTVDGTVTWLSQGATTFTALAGWVANQNHGGLARIFDGTNVQVLPSAGKSGGTAPVWNTTAGGSTVDGTATWLNAGPLPNAGLPAAAGTGGIIIDNTVNSGTLAGASQVYFFTLGNQACGTSGTGKCAIQASQSKLQ